MKKIIILNLFFTFNLMAQEKKESPHEFEIRLGYQGGVSLDSDSEQEWKSAGKIEFDYLGYADRESYFGRNYYFATEGELSAPNPVEFRVSTTLVTLDVADFWDLKPEKALLENSLIVRFSGFNLSTERNEELGLKYFNEFQIAILELGGGLKITDRIDFVASSKIAFATVAKIKRSNVDEEFSQSPAPAVSQWDPIRAEINYNFDNGNKVGLFLLVRTRNYYEDKEEKYGGAGSFDLTHLKTGLKYDATRWVGRVVYENAATKFGDAYQKGHYGDEAFKTANAAEEKDQRVYLEFLYKIGN